MSWLSRSTCSADAAGTDFIFGDDISDFYDTEPEPIIEETNMFLSSENETDMFLSSGNETDMFTEEENFDMMEDTSGMATIEEPVVEETFVEEVFEVVAVVEEPIVEEVFVEEPAEVFEEVVEDEYIEEEIKSYVKKGGKIYVGTDSMLFPHKCNFAAVIAFHDRDLKIAKYYYKQIKADAKEYKELQVKILEEVALAIQTAQFVLEVCPEADIELHIDIGTKKKNATAKFFKSIHGWVTGTGFNLRVKPNSWASSLADGHTKGRNKNGNNNKESKRNSKVNK